MTKLICALLLLTSLTACAESIKDRQSHAAVTAPPGTCYKDAMRDLDSDLRFAGTRRDTQSF